MSRLDRLIAAHPLGGKKPYNAIKFARVDHNGVPLYTVCKTKKEVGAAAALKAALETLGGHCFHCGRWMPPQPLSHACTRDHLRPRCNGGGDYLHNLVLACGPCNRSKGGDDLISFRGSRRRISEGPRRAPRPLHPRPGGAEIEAGGPHRGVK